MNKRFIIIVIFSIGLAFIEAVVVVYLRTIFYPEGFVFPLVDFISDNKRWLQFLGIETCREGATLAVLLCSSWLFGKDFRTRLAYFLTIFAVWDIFYYIWPPELNSRKFLASDNGLTDLPSLYKTDVTALADITSLPVDTMNYENISLVNAGEVYIVRTPEGEYAKVLITSVTDAELKFKWETF